jgi:hypothetical protein
VPSRRTDPASNSPLLSVTESSQSLDGFDSSMPYESYASISMGRGHGYGAPGRNVGPVIILHFVPPGTLPVDKNVSSLRLGDYF